MSQEKNEKLSVTIEISKKNWVELSESVKNLGVAVKNLKIPTLDDLSNMQFNNNTPYVMIKKELTPENISELINNKNLVVLSFYFNDNLVVSGVIKEYKTILNKKAEVVINMTDKSSYNLGHIKDLYLLKRKFL